MSGSKEFDAKYILEHVEIGAGATAVVCMMSLMMMMMMMMMIIGTLILVRQSNKFKC